MGFEESFRRSAKMYLYTLLGTNISPFKGTFEDDVPFPQVGYVSSTEGIHIYLFVPSAPNTLLEGV